MPASTIGEYVLDAVLGHGASGTVWRAHPTDQPRRTVAVKRLRAGGSPEDLARLRTEADVLAELDNLHIVRILDVVDDEHGPSIVMQFAAGGSLADLLAERGRLTPGEVVAVAAPVAEALASAHARGLVHGDVKPGNILFTSDGQPLLADFGMAEYLAPGSSATPATDVRALGDVCHRALTGDLSMTAAVPRPLGRVIERALHADPAHPFGARDLAWALRGAVGSHEIRLPGPARSPGTGTDGDTRPFGPRPAPAVAAPAAAPGRGRRVAAVGAGVVGLLAAGALVGAALFREDDPVDDTASQPCPPAAAPATPPPGASTIDGDTDGDGGADPGYWFLDPSCSPPLIVVVETAGGEAARRFAIGQEGDVPLLGDWDCDGVDTLALYRPARGELYYFNAWPASGELEAAAQVGQPTDARPEVVPGESGCDTVALEAA
jgi:serine/threonine protein kinase